MICEWNNCQESALKNVEFGKRIFHSGPEIHTSTSPYTTKRLNLCETHAKKTGDDYFHVSETALSDSSGHQEQLNTSV